MPEYILTAEHLKKVFRGREKYGKKGKDICAVEDVSFSLRKGECLGLIGESGSGKSTAAYMTAGLLKPTEGTIHFYGNYMQMVFQDPIKSLNPHRTVLDNICEGLIYRKNGKSMAEIRELALEAMDLVHLDRSYAGRKGRELSGGECQRATIARAILIEPELLICDEVTSALDVSVQAQIMELLEELKQRMGLAYLFISHDIALVNHFCDRVAVMYRGRIVEEGETGQVLFEPQQEYTKELLKSVLTF